MRILKLVVVAVLAIAAWVACAGYLALRGFWMQPVAEPGDGAAFHQWAVGELVARNKGAAALVLIEDGQVAHQHFSSDVDAATLFPTASMSKWPAALAVLSLVERGELDLDTPVARYLSRWQLPTTDFDNNAVTARALLSHTAGLTDGLGFGDYAADETVPSLEASLRSPRASSGTDVSIAVGQAPGAFKYSGGGYLILELLVEELTGMAFADYVDEAVFDPVGMERSSYAFVGDLTNVVPSYNRDGSIAPSYRYASAAATGLNSSADDLTGLVLAVLAGRGVLDEATLRSMREPHAFVMGAGIWGLGTMLYAPTADGDFAFGHDGGNEPAINASVRINPATSDGFVMLVSGHPSLASDIGGQWVLWQTGEPDFLSLGTALGTAVVPIAVGSLLILLLVLLVGRRRN